jgi:lipoyl(octanoyl) transferase
VVEAIVFWRTDPVMFLLLRRTPARGGWWQAVTGSVESGEDLETAVRREVLEETGIGELLDLVDLGYAFPFEFTKYGGKEPLEAVKHSFGVEVGGETVEIGPEHDAWEWVAHEEALERLTWEDNREAFRRLQGYLDGEAGKAERG